MEVSSERIDNPNRKVYCSPSLVVLGSIAEITQGSGVQTPFDADGVTFSGGVG